MIASITDTPAWALWLAFGLGVMNLLLWALVVVLARRTWKQLKPVVSPMLTALFGTQQSGSSSSSSKSSITVTTSAADTEAQ